MIDRHQRSDFLDDSMPTDCDTRALTVVMSVAEWQALRRVEPDPVSWLRAKVRERLDLTATVGYAVAAAHSDT